MLNHPYGKNIISAVQRGQLRAHTDDGTVSARNGGFIEQSECREKLAAGIDGTFDFQRMKHSVAFDNHVNLVGVAVAVIPQQTFLGIIMIRFY